MRLIYIITLNICLVLSAYSLAQEKDIYPFEDGQQAQLFRELTLELRCPKCQNNNIAESNAELAQDLRDVTYNMVKEGSSKQQVLDYMVARYGNFVRYDPPLSLMVIALWLAPFFVVLIGWFAIFRRARTTQASPQLNDDEQQRLDRLLSKVEQEKQ